MTIRTGLFLVFLIFPLSSRVVGASFPTEPILRIETGMHTAPINSIAADAGGHFLVTGSADKTARVWDLATGKLIRVLRPPIGSGLEGSVYAVAISPNGKLIAVGGWTGCGADGSCSIYLFDQETGDMVQRITGTPTVASNLAFSPDGKNLATAFLGKGVIVFRVEDGKEVARLKDISHHLGPYCLDWDKAGRLIVATGYSTNLYSREFKLLAEAGSGAKSARFSPDGNRVAVVSNGTVKILSGTDLHELNSSFYRPFFSGSLAWTTNAIYAAGKQSPEGLYPIYRLSEDAYVDQNKLSQGALDSQIVDLASLPLGLVAFGATGPAWGVLGANGEKRFLVNAEGADFRGSRENLSVDATGKWIRFGYQSGGKSLALFSVSERSALLLGLLGTTKRPILAPPLEAAPGLFVSPLGKSGKGYLTLDESEAVISFSVAARGESFLLGTNWKLRSFDREGKETWSTPAPAAAYAVNLSGDGRLAVAAFGDGTIRWYRADNGSELLAFFPHSDRKRWVAWTPAGYYDASVNGENLIGWHSNRRLDEAADFFPASLFRDRFYRPDVVARVLDTLDETKAVIDADLEAQRKAEASVITKLLPPVVAILSPSNEAIVRDSSVPFQISVRSPSGEPVINVKIYVDGRPIALNKDVVLETEQTPDDRKSEQITSLIVPVPARDCTVSIAAETQFAVSEPVYVKLRWFSGVPRMAKPRLYLLAVGIGAYANTNFRLDFPAKDARDVAARWELQKGRLYEDVQIKLLTDAQGSKTEIIKGFDWLEQNVAKNDVAVLYFSGHGINLRGDEYFFLPYEADLDARRSTLVSGRELLSVLSGLSGKVLLFIDTCHSGNVLGASKGPEASDLTRFINELTSAENGVVVFSASTGRQRAIEAPEWNNGVFTRALVEALEGRADLDGDHSLYITEIEGYLDRRVKELSHGLQTPVTAKPNGLPDFPVAVVGDAKK